VKFCVQCTALHVPNLCLHAGRILCVASPTLGCVQREQKNEIERSKYIYRERDLERTRESLKGLDLTFRAGLREVLLCTSTPGPYLMTGCVHTVAALWWRFRTQLEMEGPWQGHSVDHSPHKPSRYIVTQQTTLIRHVVRHSQTPRETSCYSTKVWGDHVKKDHLLNLKALA
jgi:hypothetical protein